MTESIDIYLVRHGEAEAAWGEAKDPGLSALGREQAIAAASTLIERLPLDPVTSPLARARETAAAFERVNGEQSRVVEAFGEIPTPPEAVDRRQWLREVMEGNWAQQEDLLLNWRSSALHALQQLTQPTVVFTHFVLINAVLGAIEGSDAVTSTMPANCSIHHIQLVGGELRLVALGEQLQTVVN
ncbi:MAG: broad specificity phosphatase PhoE [Halieaceae bacterium]|jgi:broad specificity phosphatase PhoE